MQDEAECLFFLADLHAMTDHATRPSCAPNVREMAAALIACGIDPDARSCSTRARFRRTPSCLAPPGTARMGWLNRMTQWKDKAGKNREGASVGLFTYPVLQAADVLLYQATHVPVGEDQKQHLELARDIAHKFNNDFDAELFTLPEPFIGGGRGPDHEPARRHRENVQVRPVGHEPDQPHRQRRRDRAKIRRRRPTRAAPRRSGGARRAARGEEPGRHLRRGHRRDRGRGARAFAGQGFGAFKPALADALVALIAPIRERLGDFASDLAELDQILADGAARASEIGAPVLASAPNPQSASRASVADLDTNDPQKLNRARCPCRSGSPRSSQECETASPVVLGAR